MAKRALRLSPLDGGSYAMLANVYWDQGRFAEALELNRFAACLNDKNEDFARSYFIAAQWFKTTEEVLRFPAGTVRAVWDEVMVAGADAGLGPVAPRSHQ